MGFFKKLFSRRSDDPGDGKDTAPTEAAETEAAGTGPEDPVGQTAADEPETASGQETASEPEASEEPDGSYEALLDRLTPDDIPDGCPSAPRRKNGRALSLVLCFIFIGVFCVSAFMLGRNIYSKYLGARIYDEIADIFENGGGERTVYVAPASTPTLTDMIKKGGGSGTAASSELARVRASLSSLRQTNPDTYGWITVEGTPVNYPIVRGSDNEYYLDHAYTGDSLPVGSIYADFRTKDALTDNRNLVIYGHNVADGSMFGCLSDYFAEEEFFDKCKIYIYTPEGIFTYKPFCVHEPGESSGFNDTWFESGESFAVFANALKDDSVFDSDVELDADSKIITLSTCTGRGHEQRYVVHAALVSAVTD